MVTSKAEPSNSCWMLRDWIAAVVLFAATADVVLWQNAHVAVLFDVGYVLNTAACIAFGQMPFRDFPLVHAPLTFLIQAAIIRLTGRVYFHHVLYAAVLGGFGTVLAWRIALASLREHLAAAWTVAILVAAPLIFLGIYCIVPNPEYDSDCAFWILVAIWLLLQIDKAAHVGAGLAAGAALILPLFFKQNMGLPFLAAAICGVLLLLSVKWFPRRQAPIAEGKRSILLSVLAGAGVALLAALLLLHWTAGVENYVHWTIRFAAQRRLPGFGDMMGIYREPSLVWTLPCVAIALIVLYAVPGKNRWLRIAAFALLSAPFLFTLTSLVLYDDADERGDSLLALWPLLLLLAAALAIRNLVGLRRKPSLQALLPLVVLAAIHGTFMSQQVWGSTYAIWPLLLLLMASLLAYLSDIRGVATLRWFVPALATIISVTLLVCGGFYTFSEERLSYAQLPAGPVEHSTFPELAGLSTPGPYLPEFDELLRYSQANIPFNDGLILIPGEEPFYFATGRVPRFPVLLFDRTTDPYSPEEAADLARLRNIRWLIVKRDLQLNTDSNPEPAATARALQVEFTLAAQLRGYDVYRR